MIAYITNKEVAVYMYSCHHKMSYILPNRLEDSPNTATALVPHTSLPIQPQHLYLTPHCQYSTCHSSSTSDIDIYTATTHLHPTPLPIVIADLLDIPHCQYSDSTFASYLIANTATTDLPNIPHCQYMNTDDAHLPHTSLPIAAIAHLPQISFPIANITNTTVGFSQLSPFN